EDIVNRVFGDVHMLSHLVGAANRADIRRLRELKQDNVALIWVHMISPENANNGKAEGFKSERIPIPARSMAIGEPDGDQAYIGISVGRAELVFSLPASSLGTIGQSLMIAGPSVNSAPS